MNRTHTARPVLTAIAVLCATIGLRGPFMAQVAIDNGPFWSAGPVTISTKESSVVSLRLPVVKNAKKPFRIAFFDQAGKLIAEIDLVPAGDGYNGSGNDWDYEIQSSFCDGHVKWVIQKRGASEPIFSRELGENGSFAFSTILYPAIDENGKAVSPLYAYTQTFDSSGLQTAFYPFLPNSGR